MYILHADLHIYVALIYDINSILIQNAVLPLETLTYAVALKFTFNESKEFIQTHSKCSLVPAVQFYYVFF